MTTKKPLPHARPHLTPAELNALKDDLLDVISRHVDIEPDEVRIGLERDGRSQRLVADIPLRSIARRRGG